MAIMKTLTVGDETYTVRDPEAVSFEQIQLLTPTQQQTARGNIGAMSAKEAADMLCPAFTESGAIVACEPVDGYPLEVEWQTKNLVQYPYSETTKTVNGITFTDNGDGTVTVNGTATANATFSLSAKRTLNLVPGANYTASIKQVSGTGTASFVVNYYKPNASSYSGWLNALITASATKPCPDDYTSARAYILVASDAVCTDLVLSVQLEAGTVATEHEPYAETATITRCGKNLCATDVVNLPGDGMNKTIWSGRLSAPLTASADLSEVQGDFAHGGAFISYVVDGNTKYASLASCGTGVKIESGTLTQMKVVNYGKFSGTARIRLETGLVKTAYEPYNGGTFAPGEPITAISGVNTIYADAGVVTVTGKANPAAIIEKLTNAILSLGGNV